MSSFPKASLGAQAAAAAVGAVEIEEIPAHFYAVMPSGQTIQPRIRATIDKFSRLILNLELIYDYDK